MIASSTPVTGYGYRSWVETLLMPRGYDLILVPTNTTTPDGVLYSSQIGEEYMQIASSLGVALEELLAENRIPEGEQQAWGQLLYIPGSLPELALRRATPVPQPTYTLSSETPVDSGAITRLMSPEITTYHTVWFEALLAMNPQRPFSDQQQQLRIQLWLSEDQALLLGGPAGEEPYDVLLWVNGDNYVASPVVASPWLRHAGNLPGELLIDPRLLYGAISFLRKTFSSGYPKYQFIGEEPIAGRPSWVIAELDEQMATGAVFNIDKQTGFILKVVRNQDDPNPRRMRATMPREAIITAIEFNVDFPQELFNPRLPLARGICPGSHRQACSASGWQVMAAIGLDNRAGSVYKVGIRLNDTSTKEVPMPGRVKDWMSSPVVVVDADSSVSYALTLMRRRNIHSLVVVIGG